MTQDKWHNRGYDDPANAMQPSAHMEGEILFSSKDLSLTNLLIGLWLYCNELQF